MQNTNLRTESKQIVFLSQLLLLFKFCHSCKDDSPLVDVTQVGTEVIVSASCKNPKCEKKETVWHSQPTIPGFGIPAGIFLLCIAILLAGGSITKVSQIFMHMGLSCVSLNTFFKHQSVSTYSCGEERIDSWSFYVTTSFTMNYGICLGIKNKMVNSLGKV